MECSSASQPIMLESNPGQKESMSQFIIFTDAECDSISQPEFQRNTILYTTPWPYRAANRARKCSLSAGHIESRIKSEFVTKEEGRIDTSRATSCLPQPRPAPPRSANHVEAGGWLDLPRAGHAGAQGASRSFTTVTCVCTCVPCTGPRRTQPCP